jgi:hypothetical protein
MDGAGRVVCMPQRVNLTSERVGINLWVFLQLVQWSQLQDFRAMDVRFWPSAEV